MILSKWNARNPCIESVEDKYQLLKKKPQVGTTIKRKIVDFFKSKAEEIREETLIEYIKRHRTEKSENSTIDVVPQELPNSDSQMDEFYPEPPSNIDKITV
jgi:hypothetical protein